MDIDSRSRVMNWIHCRLTSMNGNPIRQTFFNKVPIPSAKFIDGILYPRFKLDVDATAAAEEVVPQQLKTVDVVVRDRVSQRETRYKSNNTSALSHARSLKLPC